MAPAPRILFRLRASSPLRIKLAQQLLQPNFDPEPTAVRIHRCGYISQCKARGCLKRATLVAEKVDVAGRHVGQIELYAPHYEVVIERERSRGLEICDRRETR